MTLMLCNVQIAYISFLPVRGSVQEGGERFFLLFIFFMTKCKG